MTIRTPKPSPRSRLLFGFIAVFAVMTAALLAASQLTGDTARAEENEVPLHQSNVAFGDAEQGECPTAPDGMPYGWHFVLPGNDATFLSLDLEFEGAGAVSEPVIDGKHAFVFTAEAGTLVSGTAMVEGEVKQGFFNLSHTCAPDVEEETGSITIVKAGLLEGDTASFTHDINGGGSFDATFGDTTEVFADVAAGSYMVTEADLAGYTLTGASCTGGEAGDGVLSDRTLTIDLDAGEDLTCTFVNAAAQVAEQHTVTVTKYIDGALATTGDFSLTATWTAANLNGGVQTSGNFSLNAGNSWEAVTSLMDAGADYSVVENNIDGTCDPGDTYRLEGYGIGVDLATAIAAPLAGTASITDLQADMNIVVFNETCAAADQFDVTVTKYIDGALATAGDFSLTATWTAANLNGGAQTSGNFSLNAGNSWQAVTSLMDAGADYSVVENNIDGTCDPGDTYRLAGYGTGTSLAAAGGMTPGPTGAVTDITADMHIVVFNVSCTAPAEQVRVTTVKYLDGAVADEGSFDILFTWTAANFNGGLEDSTTIALSSANSWMHPSGLMDTGADFSVEEQGIDGTCDTGDTYRLLGYGTGATLDEADDGVDGSTAALTDLQSDQYIVVFNESCGAVGATGSIQIEKTWVGGDPETTSFTTTGLDGATFDLSDTTEFELFDGLVDGSYVITETVPDGWDVTNIVCTGHTNTVWDTDFPTGVLSINLVDDEDLVCTFTNTLESTTPAGGSLTIVKAWEDSTGAATTGVETSFTTSDSLNDADDSFTLNAGSPSITFEDLANAGVYTVTEGTLTGWTLDSIMCTGNTSSTIDSSVAGAITVTLAADEDVTCTFTNMQDETTPPAGEGSLTINKVWQDSTGATTTGVATAFTTSASLGDADNGFSLTEGSASILFTGLGDGTYVVTETSLTGWVVFGIACTGQASGIVTDFPTGVLTVNLTNDNDVICTFTNRAVSEVSPSFPETPGVTPTTPGIQNPTTPGVQNPTTPGVVSPTTPGVVSPTTPGVIEAPVANIPPTSQQPGIVSSEFPTSNIGGFQQPLPPATGNATSEGNANASMALAAGLSVVLGLAATATYAIRRR